MIKIAQKSSLRAEYPALCLYRDPFSWAAPADDMCDCAGEQIPCIISAEPPPALQHIPPASGYLRHPGRKLSLPPVAR